jgi:hypothetical protein
MKNILLVVLIAFALSLCNLSERLKKGSSNSGPTGSGSSRTIETNSSACRWQTSEVGSAGNVVDGSGGLDRRDERVEDVSHAFAGWR